jgi:hypothetical protein
MIAIIWVVKNSHGSVDFRATQLGMVSSPVNPEARTSAGLCGHPETRAGYWER